VTAPAPAAPAPLPDAVQGVIDELRRGRGQKHIPGTPVPPEDIAKMPADLKKVFGIP